MCLEIKYHRLFFSDELKTKAKVGKAKGVRKI